MKPKKSREQGKKSQGSRVSARLKEAAKRPATNSTVKSRLQASELSMVDVGAKEETWRTAEAQAKVIMSPKTLDLILKNKLPKGNVLVAAKLAGIQAAKKTADLIPLCHPLRLTSIQVEIIPQVEEKAILVISRVSALERTGVEMEALTVAASACLTIYDMAKAFDRRMVITDLHLLTKTGGKSGSFRW